MNREKSKGKNLNRFLLTAFIVMLLIAIVPSNANVTASTQEEDLVVECADQTNNVATSGTTTYIFLIYNHGASSATVIATASGVPADWSAVFNSAGIYTVPVYNGSNCVTSTLTITAGSSSQFDESYPITAIFSDGRGDEDTVTLTTTVSASPGVSLTCVDNNHTADAGDSQTYLVTIRNTGNLQDTYSLGLTGVTANWKAHIYSPTGGAVILDYGTGYPKSLATADAGSTSNIDLAKGVESKPTEISTISVAKGATKVFQVCIVSPINATNATADATLLTATSQQDGATNTTIYLNTTIVIGGGLNLHLTMGCADTEKEIEPDSVISYTITVTNPTTSTHYFVWSVDIYSHEDIDASDWVYWSLWISDQSADTTGTHKLATESNPMSTPMRLTSQATMTCYLFIDSPGSSYAEPSAEIIIDLTAVPTTRADVRSYVEITTITSSDFTGDEDDDDDDDWAIPGFGADIAVIALGCILMILIVKRTRKNGKF